MIRVAVNGFGRIGRLATRVGLLDPDIRFVAVNDITDTYVLAHLFKYDSIHGRFKGSVEHTETTLILNGNEIPVYAKKNPAELPWKDLHVDVVIECTGRFTKRGDAAKHLEAGAKKVLISAPSKDADITIVKGCNEHAYDKTRHHIVSNASCTTNCLAPVAKVLNDNYGILRGYMTTVHADTNDQHVLDLPHKDLRRARAAGLSIIPTTTGAAQAVSKVVPLLAGKLDGMAMRVPILDGSITDFVCELEKPASAEEINTLFRNVAQYHLQGILSYTEEPIVSVDIIDNPHSCIVDGLSTRSFGRLVKVVAWYDNEWGYSNRLIDVAKLML